MLPRLALIKWSFYLQIVSAGITEVYCHTQLVMYSYVIGYPLDGCSVFLTKSYLETKR
jgi:hypothetical protein